MKVIDQINGSALFAQSAYSAAVATKDELGRDITATYLTAHQSLEDYATTSDLEQVSAEVTDKLDTTAQVISSCETSSIDGETLVTKLNGNEIAVGYAASARIANIALKDYQGNSFVPFYAKTSALEEKLDTTAFSTVSGDFLTAVNIPESATWQDVSETVQSNSAQWAEGGSGGSGDTEVNAYVYNNSASIDGTTSVVQSNSSTWSDITAYQSNSATLNEVSTTVQTNSAQWGQGGGAGDEEVNTLVHTNSATWNTVTDKLDTTAQVVTSYTTATAGLQTGVNSLNGNPLLAYSAEAAAWAYNAYNDSEGNSILGTHNSLTALNEFVQTNSSNYIPYTASGVGLPNSHFKVDTDGRAYKLEVVNSAEQPLNDNFFQQRNTLNYPFGKGKRYIVNVPSNRTNFLVRGSLLEVICSGVVQNGVCDFVYPSSGVTGYKYFDTYDNHILETLTTANCKLYYFTTTSPSSQYVLSSELPTYEYDSSNKISAINGSAVRYPDSSALLPYPMEFVSTSSEATGTNILYIVTGTGE